MRDDTKNKCVADYEERRKKSASEARVKSGHSACFACRFVYILFTPFFGIFFPTVKAGPRLALHLGISLGGYREKSIE